MILIIMEANSTDGNERVIGQVIGHGLSYIYTNTTCPVFVCDIFISSIFILYL